MPRALDLFGSATDPAWTGEEIAADTAPEPSDRDLALRAFTQVTRQACDDPRGCIDHDHPREDEILTALHAHRDTEFAARRRWRATAMRLSWLLHEKRLRAAAMGDDGELHELPPHLWAARNAQFLFDNGGIVEIRNGRFVIAEEGGEDIALILIDEANLRAATGGNEQNVHPYHTGLPGRPTIAHVIRAEFQRRVGAGECKGTLREEAEALARWAKSARPEAPAPTSKTIENQIRALYTARVRPTK